MNRILALQGLTPSTQAVVIAPASGESNLCSSATTKCSTFSVGGCAKDAEISW